LAAKVQIIIKREERKEEFLREKRKEKKEKRVF